MKKNLKKLVSLIYLSFVFLITNCTTDETSKNKIDKHAIEAEDWYNNYQKNYEVAVLKYIKELQWQDAIITDGISGEVVEVPFVLKDGLSVSNTAKDLFNNNHRLMFIKNEENGFDVFYVEIFTNQKNEKPLDKSYNYYSLKNDFDGVVYIQELKSNIKNRLEFKNGNQIKSSSQTAKNDQRMCLYYGYWYDDGHFEPLVEMGCYGGEEGDIGDMPSYGGGGSGGAPPSKPTVNEYACPQGYEYNSGECVLINKNKLCGTYNFKVVGNAYVANISGLGFSASSPSGDKVFADLPTVCVTIPNYNLQLSMSSAQFNIAWLNTMHELMTYLNNTTGIINPTPWKLRGLILEFLTANLNYAAGLNSGVSIITGTCSGVPSSVAVYCK